MDRGRTGRLVWIVAAACLAAAGPSVAADAPARQSGPSVEEFQVETSDGVTVAAWCYRVAEDVSPPGVVILLHDAGGSHRSVEPLATVLRDAGCVVVAPDLRGHGASPLPTLPRGPDQARLLRKADFEMMAASRGGRVREQADVRGDVESLHGWIRREAAEGRIPDAPLVVVGSGLGAAVAAHWTAADALWPDLATGRQGGLVAALVLVSPAVSSRGFSFAPILSSDALRSTVPVLVLAGGDDRDAARVFEQLKRLRPRDWFDSRRPPGGDKAASPVPWADATLRLLTHPSDARADALAAVRSADPRSRQVDPGSVITGFVRAVAAATRP